MSFISNEPILEEGDPLSFVISVLNPETPRQALRLDLRRCERPLAGIGGR